MEDYNSRSEEALDWSKPLLNIISLCLPMKGNLGANLSKYNRELPLN